MKSGASLLGDVINAHGGVDRWLRAGALTVHHSSGGFAFAAKFQGRTLSTRLAQISTDHQRTVFSTYPGPGRRGSFDKGTVQIETDGGRLLTRRLDPRSDLRRLRHKLWWDKLDLLYFTGSALWTYMATPFIFATPGFEVQELEPWKEKGEAWRRLAVTFPVEYHTHSRHQVFYFSSDGLVRRQDYTAEEFGKRAYAAHYCFDHREFDGLVFPTRRRVFLRRPDGRPRPWPQLIWIDIQAVDVGAKHPTGPA
jgi:hypothetical protein